MDRLTISLPPTQISWLKHEAKRLGITVGEVLRRVIDLTREWQKEKSR